MSIGLRSRGMRIVGDSDSTRVLDVHCGHCRACRAGLDLWCLDQLAEGPELMVLERAVVADELHRWLGALGALAHLATQASSRASVLLVLERVDPTAATDLVRPWHPGPVLASVDGRDEEARARLSALSPTGRAQIVLARTDARTAVRSVERGGHVCLPDLGVEPPSVTELVQRDVKLVAPRRIDDLVAATSWVELAGRIHQLLDLVPSPTKEIPRV